ncbi:hypothetical protein K469DRAFT_794319 [Zopfia rhizophila CBS 207.26]|uniref:Uncharacterized protein n=1 Tax=Zopfia rhizophila CBS 207.26 TaxID=1314779 RepID=A0A6A6DNQ4_9PEZI|nr:hypothetical protein K469DRAFT_794319 [Zopfia rhizophila CBS 207.26]
MPHSGPAKDGMALNPMAHRSQAFCTRVSRHTRVGLMSKSAAQTLVVTLQGAQTAYDTANRFAAGDLGKTTAMPSVFSLIAIPGLVRPATILWLTKDFSFADVDSGRHVSRELKSIKTKYSLEIDQISLEKHPHYFWRVLLIPKPPVCAIGSILHPFVHVLHSFEACFKYLQHKKPYS